MYVPSHTGYQRLHLHQGGKLDVPLRRKIGAEKAFGAEALDEPNKINPALTPPHNGLPLAS